MKVLVTGAKGFAGRNLCAALAAIRDGKDRRARYQSLLPLEVFEYDADGSHEELARWCAACDFVIHLAGVNRPADGDYSGNISALEEVLECLEAAGSRCPVLLSSSVQAAGEGRFAGSAYGASKRSAEELLRAYGARTGAKTLIYRLPNLYGKWCRPNYNSAVATFCDAIANGRSYTVNDPSTQLELLYIDDLVGELLAALIGDEHREGDFCIAGPTDHVTLGEIVHLLEGFKAGRASLEVPDLAEGSFSKKLYSTFQSYIDAADFSNALQMRSDERGSFTEVLKSSDRGQVSINVIKPGAVKGNHWHHTKCEKFLVVSGEGLIRMRRIGMDASGEAFPVAEYRVSGDALTVVEMVPGYTHSIANVSDEHDLVVLIWASDCFDPERPDTFFEEV